MVAVPILKLLDGLEFGPDLDGGGRGMETELRGAAAGAEDDGRAGADVEGGVAGALANQEIGKVMPGGDVRGPRKVVHILGAHLPDEGVVAAAVAEELRAFIGGEGGLRGSGQDAGQGQKESE